MADNFKTIKVPAMLHRTGIGIFDPATDTLKMSISSDIPYLRYDWWDDEEYYEVLDHSDGGMDLSRLKGGASLLYNHNRDVLLGLLTNPVIEQGKCNVEAKISKADDVASYRTKIDEGILKDTSIGYTLLDEGECIGAKDGVPIYKFKSAVHEASLVTIPADTTVGIGRQREHKPKGEPHEIRVRMQDSVDAPEARRQNQNNSKTTMADSAVQDPPKIDVVKERGDAVIEYEKHRDRLEAHAEAIKDRTKKEAPDVLKSWVKGEKKLKPSATEQERENHFSQFQAAYAEAAFKAVEAQVNPEIGMEKKDRRRFSLCRLMLKAGLGEELDGIEKEACETARKLYTNGGNGGNIARSGFTIPEDMTRCNLAEDHDLSSREIASRLHDIQQMQVALGRATLSRALTATNFSAGGALVGVELLTGSIIDLLRNNVIMTGLGCTEIGGIVGDIAIPRVSGGATVYWLPEGGAVTESDQTFQQIYFTPHRMGADTAYTKQLLAQASLSVEAFVRDDIAKQMAVEEDRVGFNGLGANGEPLGIFNTTGVGAGVTFGGNATWKSVNAFIFDIENANALLGEVIYVTTPQTKYYLKITPQIAASTFPIWIWEKDPAGRTINGNRGGIIGDYSAFSTKNVPNNLVVAGVWSEFVKVRWAGVDVVVDPYSLKKSEQIEITVHQYMDQGVRHPVAFDTSTDAPTSP
jgi:HK97 family phage major capsid protein